MTNENSSANRITIDVRALRHNYRLISASVPDAVEVMAMVKGDGYGHGMIEAARAFAAAGCRVFGVAELCEGVRLRRSGIEGDIYVMVGFLPEQVEVYFSHDLIPVVYSRQIIELVSAAAVRLNRSIGLHLKIDTGMGRLGVLPDEIETFATLIEKLPNVHLAGVLSHFAEADNAQSPETEKAFAAFTAACDRLAGRFSGLRHIANSGAVLNFPETLGNMVRAGIALYGYSPDGSREGALVGSEYLRPAMRYATRIAMVKTVPAGTGISYGHTYVTTRSTRLAALPVGYEDGYPRALSNKGEVLIHGHKVPIRGRICMNLCMADITDLEGVKEGDEAVLMGEQGGAVITADDIAAKIGTISYEIVCMLGSNNQRSYTS